METTPILEEIKLSEEQIFNTYSKKMMGVCLRYIPSKKTSEKILENSFVEFFKNPPEDVNEDSIKKILINNIVQYLLTPDNSIGATTITHYVTTSEANQNNLIRMLYNLPIGYRLVFNLHLIDGYSFQEISEILNVPEQDLEVEYKKAKDIIGTKLN